MIEVLNKNSSIYSSAGCFQKKLIVEVEIPGEDDIIELSYFEALNKMLECCDQAIFDELIEMDSQTSIEIGIRKWKEGIGHDKSC